MPTEHSWTELRAGVGDLRALLAFRRSGMSTASKKRLQFSGGFVGGLTVAAIVIPAYLREPLGARHSGDVVALLPSFYLGFALLAILGSITSGGGREIVPRDEAVAFPISSVTEHLGALLLAPLNVAWLIQAWAILGATSYVLGPHDLAGSTLQVLLWIAFSTAFGQAVGWWFEGVRRGPNGTTAVRAITAGAGAVVAVLVLTHHLTGLLDRSPTVHVYVAATYAANGDIPRATASALVLLGLLLLAVVVGLYPARWALRRPQREELRLEGQRHRAHAQPTSDLVALLRIDRASIWRSVPLRRGLLVLAMLPGAVALAGTLQWHMITILPGLVASGGALLFGVNAWCLDGRGALWRDSLPVAPELGYVAKVIVLYEVLLAAGGLTIVLAAVRAGVPNSAELTSVVAATLVVSSQVVSTSMRWSVRSPYAVDLRSARATPAPPVVMAGYSARLALATTVTGLIFSGTALAPDGRLAALVALPLLCWSAYRLVRTSAAWAQPITRARVIAVVAT